MARRPTLRSIRFDPIGLMNRAFLSLSVCQKGFSSQAFLKAKKKALNQKALDKESVRKESS